MYLIEIFIVVFLGLVLGSFSTALIYRVPRKLPWGGVRSACTECKTNLGVIDLVPVISWCIFKGKCRHCSNKVSFKYPLIEILSVLLCLTIYFVFGISPESFFIIISVPILLSLFVIDIEHMILPNQLVFILFIMGVVRLFYNMSYGYGYGYGYYDYMAGAVIYFIFSWGLGALFSRVLKKDALGFGDVKFFAVAGIWLGLSMFPYFLIVSGGGAILFALCWRIFNKSEAFPFGPALVISLYLLLLFSGMKIF